MKLNPLSERGNLALAIVVSILATISGVTMSQIALGDSGDLLYQFDAMQELHFLRSEIGRGYSLAEKISGSITSYVLPVRKVEMRNGHSRTTYSMKSRIETEQIYTDYLSTPRKTVSGMVRAFRRRSSDVTFNSSQNKSPVEKYGQKIAQRSSLSEYMYFSETDESVNGDQVFFWGPDVIWGKLHSNSDIWLKQAGGGTNGGWPTFHGEVTTSGIIHAFSGTIPYDDVFLGGYKEEVAQIEFPQLALDVRQNSVRPFGEQHHDIVWVTIDGSGYTGMIGDIIEHPPDSVYVYDVFPPYPPGNPFVGDSIGVNMIVFKDTTWLPAQSGSIQQQSAFVFADELWLSGEVSGMQTWACSGDIYLKGDITYHHTPVGMPPDGQIDPSSPEPEAPINNTDIFGCVAEGSILVQYGHFDPEDSVRVTPNCGDGIYLYGSFCALGDGGGISQLDGVFSFQYQKPHWSTPGVMFAGEWFPYPDLHMCYYPPGNTPYWPHPANGGGGYNYPFPNGPDYPWYNPLYPEFQPFMERGTIHLYGGVHQRRRGFVHRSPYDPLDQGWWELEEFRYGPTSNGVNATGATGNGCGYAKDYHFDERLRKYYPPNYPPVIFQGGGVQYRGIGMILKKPPSYF